MQETQVLPLGWEDALEKGMDGNPLLYCLELSLDRGAWWATVQEAMFSRSKYSKAQDLFLKNLYSNAASFQ